MARVKLDDETRLKLLRAKRQKEIAGLPLQDFIPALRPDLESPKHLSDFTDFFERSLTQEVRALTSTPPQHFKTITAVAGLLWLALRRPKRYMYITYSYDRSTAVQKEALIFAQALGVAFKSVSSTDWVLSNDASIRWLGFGGAIGGYPVDGLILVDDPYKGMDEARSEAIRGSVETAWRSAIWPRMHPGASVIMISTRWGLDDLFGTLQPETFPSGNKWEVINLPAISPQGKELLPCTPTCLPKCSKHRPLWWLADKKAGMDIYSWEAEYMGRPRPEGMAVFGVPATYSELPRQGLRWSIGIDMAYTESTSADWFVAVVMAVMGEGALAIYYVVQVVRGQAQLPVFATALQRLKATYPSAQIFTSYGVQEKVIIREVLNRPVENGGYGLNIHGKQALTDKLSRAQSVAMAWNAGRVLVPDQNLAWVGPFLREVQRFTGTEADKNDDQVDALADAHHMLSRGQKVIVFDTPKLSDKPEFQAMKVDSQQDLAFQLLLKHQGM